MFSVKIRQSIMIAHSLPHAFFGPAQGLHGATYVVDAEFFATQLDPHNVVMDIGHAKTVLDEVLQTLAYKNLDEEPQFAGQLTTTEYLAAYIHRCLCDKVAEVFSGELRVTLGETHDAWASYQAPVGAGSN